MAALTQAQFDILTTMIEKAFHKHREFHPVELTKRDIVEGFVNSEDLETLKRVSELYADRLKYNPERLGIEVLTMQYERPFGIIFGLQETAYLPDYAIEGGIAAGPGYEKVLREANRYIELFFDYNLMTAVLTKLDEVCTTAGQIAFIWPTIRDLAGMAHEAGEKVDTLLKALDKKTTAPIPRISPALREACRATGQTITVLKMMGDPPSPTARQVDVWPRYAMIRSVYEQSMLDRLA